MIRHAKAPSAGTTSGRVGACLSLLAVAILATCALFAPAAQAGKVPGFGILGTGTGAGAGQIGASPKGVSVNTTGAGGVSAGDVYVADFGNHRIDEFSGSGEFVRAFGIDVVETGGADDAGTGYEICEAESSPLDECKAGASSSEAGGLPAPAGIGVDPATGNLFVPDNTSHRVNVFSATGHFEGAFGWNVDATTPEEQLQFCTVVTGCQAGTSGAGAGQFRSFGSKGLSLAVSPLNGHLLVPEPENRRVSEFSLTLNGSDEVTGVAFLKAFGADVTPTYDEEQEVALAGATGGSFSLGFGSDTTAASATGHLKAGSNEVSEFEPSSGKFIAGEEVSGNGIPAGTKITAVSFDSLTLSAAATETKDGAALSAALPFDVSADVMEGALQALPSIGSENVAVTGADGGPWTVEFTGALGGVDVASLSGDASGLSGTTPSVEVTTVQTGANGTNELFESCTTATTCKEGGGYRPNQGKFEGGPGGFPKGTPVSVPVDSSGAIYATGQPSGCSEEACRVQKFNAAATEVESFAPTLLQQPDNATPIAAAAQQVAVDPVNDHVLVTIRSATTNFHILEFSKSGALIESSPPGEAGIFGNSGGIAIGTEERDYLINGSVVRILGNPPTPSATVESADEITTTSATVHGVAKPSAEGVEGGFPTVAYFEYSADGVRWTSTREVEIGDGSGAGSPSSCPTGNPPTCAVSREVKSLHPGTTYLVRLVVSNGTKTTSSTTSFETTPAGPTVSDMSPNPVGETTATISGLVGPNSRPTTYHLEWGADASYGTRIPAEYDVVAGSGSQPVRASSSLKGLAPNTTYHYRIVASNSAGTTYGEDATFTTLNSSGLADNRGIELVSPPDKRPTGGVDKVDIASLDDYYHAAEDGEAVGYPILTGLEDSKVGGEVMYAANRSASGWSTSAVSSPSLISNPDPGFPLAPANHAGFVKYYSPAHLSCALIETFNPVTDDTPPADIEAGAYNLYRLDRATGVYTLITSEVPSNPTTKTGASSYFKVAGVNRDCTQVFFQSVYKYFPSSQSQLYEWDEGTLRDAGLLPDGSVPAGQVGPSTETLLSGLVSPEGQLVFTARSNEGADSGRNAVFVRISPAETVDATASSSCGGSYEAASADGSHVLYIGCEERLYSYDVETGETTEISADPNPEDTAGPVVLGASAISEDGSTVYFTARGQLVPGEGRTYAQNEGAEFASIYRWHAGSLDYVGSVNSEDLSRSRFGDPLMHDGGSLTAQTTKSGDYLLFTSHDDIDGTNPNGVEMAYLYSVSDNTTSCVSCPPQEGSFPHREGPEVIRNNKNGTGMFNRTPLSLSEDGRVFFTSLEALTPGAIEGQQISGLNRFEDNVYEWHDGQVALLAAGIVEFIDSGGPDGRDVFIRAYGHLNSEDTDFAPDLYDFRAGGGFAPKPPPPPPCDVSTGACQGQGSAAPAASSPASTSFSGSGNPPVPAEAKRHKAKKHKHKKRRHKHRKKKRHAKRHHLKKHAKHNRGGAK